MKILLRFIVVFFQIVLVVHVAHSSNTIPANNPYIQYYGRWDFSNPLAPTHSWPGVYLYAEFEGTSIGIITDDNFSYYNVFIDDTVVSIFHGTKGGVNFYTLVSSLLDGHHRILLTLRNETNWTKFSFNGFILDDGKNLLPPPDKPVKKIEFIGDSYTCSSGNLWTDNNPAPSGDYTDAYEGFPSITARHYGTQYMVSGRGGFGLVLDYQGNYSNNLPSIFNRTLVYTPSPAWDFSQWSPNLVVICLGLNDYNGWGGYNGAIDSDKANLFRQRYHEFLSTIMDVYPFAKILTVAANDILWLKQQISSVFSEENAMGHTNISYTFFPYYSGHYVNSGHPDVYAHHQISDKLVAAIDTIDAWTPFHDTVPPKFVHLPDTPLVVTSSSYSLMVKTNKFASVRYSTQDKAFDQMENVFTTTGTRVHSVVLPCTQNTHYTYYLRAKDVYGNEIDSSAVVRFNVDTTKVLLTWRSQEYNLLQWKQGTAPLGNDGASSNSPQLNPTKTAYFRQSILLQNVSSINDLRVAIVGHDGVIAFLNDQEIGRINIDPNTDVTYNTSATVPMTLMSSFVMNRTSNPTYLNYLHEGENIFAFEVHSRSTASPDVSFDAQVFDINSTIYYALGSSWYFYDKGNAPANQLEDKTTGIFTQNNDLVPGRTYLYPNYPNPFNPTTTIKFSMAQSGNVSLTVFDLLGRKVATLADKHMEAGVYTVNFDATQCASGVYFYRLEAGKFLSQKKMLLLR